MVFLAVVVKLVDWLDRDTSCPTRAIKNGYSSLAVPLK